MLIAAHPDDESLACSVVLQRAAHARAEIRVIYVTDGENNPWPQRLLERKWRLIENDRKRWGELRRTEALSALKILGVNARGASFLGLPDQGLTELLISKAQPLIERLGETVEAWEPTDLFIPSVLDIHPDHSALGVLLRLVAHNSSSLQAGVSVWSYLVHGNSSAFADRARTIGQTAAEKAIKLRAIGCHQTQVRLFGKRFWNHACQAERFVKLNSAETIKNAGGISSASRHAQLLSFRLERPLKVISPRNSALLILGYDEAGKIRGTKVELPLRASPLEMRDISTGRPLTRGHYSGGAFAGSLEVPIDVFSPTDPLFIKIARRGWFFDKAGWLELPPCGRVGATPSHESWHERATPENIALLRKLTSVGSALFQARSVSPNEKNHSSSWRSKAPSRSKRSGRTESIVTKSATK